MIYYYFKNKEGLYEAVLNRFLSQFSARSESGRRPARASRAITWSRWCGPISITSESTATSPSSSMPSFSAPTKACWRGTLMSATQQVQDLLIEACRKAVASGLVRPERLEALVTALNGMINLWVIVTVKQEADLSRDVAVQKSSIWSWTAWPRRQGARMG